MTDFVQLRERMVRQHSAAGNPAFLYLFDHCYPAARARGQCAFHASELPYVFGNREARPGLDARKRRISRG